MKRLKSVFLLLIVVFLLSACAPALQIGVGLIGESLGDQEKQQKQQKPEKTIIKNEKGEIVEIIYNRK